METPKLPTITQCSFRALAIGLTTCSWSADLSEETPRPISGHGASGMEAYDDMLANLFDAYMGLDGSDNSKAEELYRAIKSATSGVTQ